MQLAVLSSRIKTGSGLGVLIPDRTDPRESPNCERADCRKDCRVNHLGHEIADLDRGQMHDRIGFEIPSSAVDRPAG